MFQTIVLMTEPKRSRISGSFRFFLFPEKKGVLYITYFVDHKNKKIHFQRFAGDKCGFLDTPLEEREFTAVEEYIQNLETAEGFSFCTHCQTPQLIM